MRQVAMRCWPRTARRPADRRGLAGQPRGERRGWHPTPTPRSSRLRSRPVPPPLDSGSNSPAVRRRPAAVLRRALCVGLAVTQQLGAAEFEGAGALQVFELERRPPRPQNRGVVRGRRFCGSCRQSARTLDPASKIISRAGSGVSEPVLVAPAQHGPEPRRQDRRGARQVTVERTRRPGEHTRSPGFLFP